VHVVVGSSGLSAGNYAELDRLARDWGVGVVAAGNFSIMAPILKRAAAQAAQHLEHWEILDYASVDNPDVPSGTSRELAVPGVGIDCAKRRPAQTTANKTHRTRLNRLRYPRGQ
jgi:4-hydroxy-tetrahydrodipicolinate reductase